MKLIRSQPGRERAVNIVVDLGAKLREHEREAREPEEQARASQLGLCNCALELRFCRFSTPDVIEEQRAAGGINEPGRAKRPGLKPIGNLLDNRARAGSKRTVEQRSPAGHRESVPPAHQDRG